MRRKYQEFYIYRCIYQGLTRIAVPPCLKVIKANYLKVRVKVLRIYVGSHDIYYVCRKVGNPSTIYEFPDGQQIQDKLTEFIIKQSEIDCFLIKLFNIN